MQIDIEATNLELTLPLREYIEKKIGKLSKFLSRFEEEGVHARVEVARSSKHHRHGKVYRAEANLHFPGGMLRAEHEAEDARVAIDKVKDKLQREIRKYKTTH
jgi:putative sigma-54 modulation protein